MAKAEIRAEILTESEYPEWNELVATAPAGSVYARPEYLDGLCTAGGGRFRILGVRQGDLLLGGIGLYERDGAFGRYLSPRLLLYYNGPVLARHETKYPSERTARELKALSAMEAWIRGNRYGSVALKPRSPLSDLRSFLACGWTASHHYTYVVSVTDLPLARARVEQNLRRLIDRCARGSYEVTEDDDFESFYRLHLSTMARVNVAPYLPKDAFHGFHDTLARQGLARLFHARLPSGEAVASQLVLLGHPVTHTVTAGANPDHLKAGVTPFLRWRVFERLAALGYTANDLTDASLNPVTHFKSQLGGALEPLIELRSVPSLRFRVGTDVVRAVARSRATAGQLVRKLLVRRRGAVGGVQDE
ncbi:MAG TPA: GNAT family N-acetyltransferase [Gemmatimonadaceae bacterium]|nr:GNAT family N-acetyltransferase [Gemmatimonadaceae bacterium]